MDTDMNLELDTEPQIKKKKNKPSSLVTTFFKNGLRSNLDLTTLADTKAGILISINGFILTVIVTASGFAVQNSMMNYAFISIILTALVSIVLAVLAVRPRSKEKMVNKKYLAEYGSLLYFQDIANIPPNEYMEEMLKTLEDTKLSKEHMIRHLHILGSEIKHKYFWLNQAYTYFSIGLVISAGLVINGLTYVEQSAFYTLSKGNISYKIDKFNNIFEPSGATTLPDGKVLIVEDDQKATFKIIDVDLNGNILELNKLKMPKKMANILKNGIDDLEGVTSNGNIIYAITSHSVKLNGKSTSKRDQIVRLEYSDGEVTELFMFAGLREALISNFPKLFNKSKFQKNNLNIEGLCFDEQNNELLIAFRTPLSSEQAIVMAVSNIEDVFLDSADMKFSKPSFLKLEGLGIRGLSYDKLKGGFWIIAGSSKDRDKAFTLWFWDRENNLVSKIKNQPNIGFAEGITIVHGNSENPSVLIVQDNGKKPNKAAGLILIDKKGL